MNTAARSTMSARRILLALLASVLLALPALPARAAGPGDLDWSVSIGGRPLSEVDGNRPLVLHGTDTPTRIVLDVTNRGTDEQRIRSLRLVGRVMGLAFFSYSTRLDIVLAPGENTQRQIDLDLDALDTQATGLIPASVELVDADRHSLGTKSFPSDVQGSVLSVYSLFGIAVLLITIVLTASLLLSIRGRRLPTNRWQRGIRFAVVGLGLGLTLTFSLSALSLLSPSTPVWLSLVLGFGAVALLIGYFLPLGTPTPAPTDPSALPDEQWPTAGADQAPGGVSGGRHT